MRALTGTDGFRTWLRPAVTDLSMDRVSATRPPSPSVTSPPSRLLGLGGVVENVNMGHSSAEPDDIAFAAALWEALGKLHLHGQRLVTARINSSDEELLHRFQNALGVGRIHIRAGGRYWGTGSRSELTTLVRKTWRYLSPERREQFRTALPAAVDVIADPDEMALPCASWTAGILVLAGFKARATRMRVRLPAKGTLPMNVLTRFRTYAGAGQVVEVAPEPTTTSRHGFWEGSSLDEIQRLLAIRSLVLTRTLGRIMEALSDYPRPARRRSPRALCSRCGDEITTAFRVGRQREVRACGCGLRYVDLAELRVILRSWELDGRSIDPALARLTEIRSVSPSRMPRRPPPLWNAMLAATARR